VIVWSGLRQAGKEFQPTTLFVWKSVPQGLKSVCENSISKLSPAGTAELQTCPNCCIRSAIMIRWRSLGQRSCWDLCNRGWIHPRASRRIARSNAGTQKRVVCDKGTRYPRFTRCGKIPVLRRKPPSAAKAEFLTQQLCTA
jgi:hypothetical protein